MKKLLKYWNQNRQKILITIGIVVFIIVFIRVANEMVKQKNRDKQNNITNNVETTQDVTKPNESIITDTTLTEEQVEENSKIIKNFVQYCNEKNLEQAYNLLSNDCKQEVYTSLQSFAENYVNQIFSTIKTYKLELWAQGNNSSTYRITYNEGNVLQTGGYSSTGNYMDYITIVKEEEQELKLNINKMVTKQILNKTNGNESVTITIDNRTIYTDYEIYNVTVKNNTNKTILLNNGNMANNICLVSDNQIEYNSIINELSINTLTLEAGYQKTFKIKFNKMYTGKNNIKYMRIKDIYLDKSQYDQNLNIDQIERTSLDIKL